MEQEIKMKIRYLILMVWLFAISNASSTQSFIVLTEDNNTKSITEKKLQYDTVIQTDKAEIIFEEPRLLQLDGEVIQKYDRLSIELLKGAVKFITTKDNLYYKS